MRPGPTGTAGRKATLRRFTLSVSIILILTCLSPEALRCSVEVAASIFPISSIVSEIGGNKVTVTTIVPTESDPHHFELTPKTARAVYEAEIVCLIGGHFDRWLLAGDTDGPEAPRLIEFRKVIKDSLIMIGDSFNPHFWLDPLIAKVMGKTIGEALCAVDTSNCVYYQARTKAFLAEIDSLHAATRKRLADSGFRDFVAFHPAWTYFARRYGLDEIDILQLTPEQEPSARRMAGVAKKMKQKAVRFIIAEVFSNRALAEGLAAETGADIIILDPLGGEDMPGRESYFGLIDYNTSVIEAEMDRQAGKARARGQTSKKSRTTRSGAGG